MPGSIRVLILEDRAFDAELMLYELRRFGFETEAQVVATEAEFEMALRSAPDVIIADHTLPQWDGLQALDLVRARGLEIPFILVSGAINPQAAKKAIERGAAACLSKDNLALVGAAITRALGPRLDSTNP